MFFRLWFTSYWQENILFQHVELTNAAQKEAIEYSPSSLRVRCGRKVFASNSFHITSDVDKGSLCPKPFHGHLQTLNVRALHQYREKEPIGHLLAGRRCFFAERAARGRPQLHQGHGGRAVRRRGAGGSERVRNAAGTGACSVASVEG